MRLLAATKTLARALARRARREPLLAALFVVLAAVTGVLAYLWARSHREEGWAFVDTKPQDISAPHRDNIARMCARGVTMDDLTKTADWDYLAKYDRDEVAALCTQARTEARARAAQYPDLDRTAQCKAAGREQCPSAELRVDYPCKNKKYAEEPKCCGYDGKFCVSTAYAAGLRLPATARGAAKAPRVQVFSEPGFLGQVTEYAAGGPAAVLDGTASSLRIPPNMRVTLENDAGGVIRFNGGADGQDVGSLRYYSSVTNRLTPVRVRAHWNDRARRIKVESGRFDLDGGDHGNLRFADAAPAVAVVVAKDAAAKNSVKPE